MSWKKYQIKDFLKQYRVQHIVQDDVDYKQVSILNDGSVVLRGIKIGKEIGRKRQFIIDLVNNPNTLIFTRQLLLQGSIGIAPNDVNGCIVTENMPMFSIDVNKIDRTFLMLFLKSEVFKSRIRKIELSGSAQKSIHERTFLDLEFSFPDIDEQKVLVERLTENHNNGYGLSTEIETQLSLVKQLRQSFLSEAMQGKLVKAPSQQERAGGEVETGQQLLARIKAEKAQLVKDKKLKKEKELPHITAEDIPFEIPEDWVWCRLGDLIELSSGQDLNPSQYSDTKEIGLPYITGASNLQKGIVVVNRWTNNPKSIAKKNDLLLTCKGSGVGKMAYLHLEEVHIARQIMAIRTRFVKLKYIHLILSNNVKSFKVNAKSLIPGIDRPQVLNILTPLPPISIQNQIVAKLDELMKFCDDLESSIKQSQLQNEQLLQQVLKEALEVREEVLSN